MPAGKDKWCFISEDYLAEQNVLSIIKECMPSGTQESKNPMKNSSLHLSIREHTRTTLQPSVFSFPTNDDGFISKCLNTDVAE